MSLKHKENQLRSFQELLLRKAQVDRGINLISALKNFVPFSRKTFHVLEPQPTILFKEQLIRKFFKIFHYNENDHFCRKRTITTTFSDGFRSSYPEVFFKIASLNDLRNFPRKHLRWRVLLVKSKRIYCYGFSSDNFVEFSNVQC